MSVLPTNARLEAGRAFVVRRKSLGLTRAHLAVLADVSITSVDNAEHGVSQIMLERLNAALDAIELGRQPEPFVAPPEPFGETDRREDAARLKERRERLGLTKRRVAELSGLSTSSVAVAELTGASVTMAKINEALDNYEAPAEASASDASASEPNRPVLTPSHRETVKNVLYRAPVDLIQSIDAAAEQAGLSRNEAMTQFLRFALNLHLTESKP